MKEQSRGGQVFRGTLAKTLGLILAACSAEDQVSDARRPDVDATQTQTQKPQSSQISRANAVKKSTQLARQFTAQGASIAKQTIKLPPAANELVLQLSSRAALNGQAHVAARKEAIRKSLSAGLGRVNAGGLVIKDIVSSSNDPNAPVIVKLNFDPKLTDATALARELERLPEVEHAEPNYVYELFATPNDPNYFEQTHLSTISAPAAWDRTTGAPSVVVAVIDTGVDYTHPDLAANIWQNTDEFAGDGIDNDHNGFVDDVRGYDFVSVDPSKVAPEEDPGPPDANPMDVHSHGTHVAGIVGAVGNNGVHGTGVAWRASLMALRAGYKQPNGNGSLELSDIAAAVRYAADNGAQIISMSFGGDQPSRILYDAMKYAADRGLLLIAAAGNTGNTTSQYPGAFENVVSIAATDDAGILAGFSTFGPWVDLAAPGVEVLSTIPGGGTSRQSGTSMATPVVAGVAALVKASHPTWNAARITQQLLGTSLSVDGQNATRVGVMGAGLVNAQRAVQDTTPAPIAQVVHTLFEELSGDGDGEVEPGETGRLHAAVKNFGPTTNINVSLQSLESGVTISTPALQLTNLGLTRIAAAKFDFTLPASLPRNRALQFAVNWSAGTSNGSRSVALDPAPIWAAPRILSERYPFAHYMTGLNDETPVIVAELDGANGNIDTIDVLVRDSNGNWPSTQLSGPSNAHQPAFNKAADGSLDVVYERNVAPWNNQIFYRHYTPSTRTWGPEEQVTTDAVIFGLTGIVSTNFAVQAEGNRVHVVWADSGSTPPVLRSRYRTSAGWQNGNVISTLNDTELSTVIVDMQLVSSTSRRLFYSAYSATGSWRRATVSGSGTTWGRESSLTQFYDAPPTFKNATNIYQFYKQNHWSDSVNLARFNGSSFVFDRTITLNLTGNWGSMSERSSVAMGSSTNFGVFFEASEHGPFEYYSGTAGALTPARVGGRVDFNIASAKLWLSSTNVAHAILGMYPVTGFWITEGQLVYYSSQTPSGVTLPSKPTVNAPVVNSTTQLSASWSATHPAGISKYVFAVGSAPGLSDIVSFRTATGTEVVLDLSENPLDPSQTYFVSVRAISNTGYTSALGVSGTTSQCTPSCAGKACGSDGCGGTCGTCQPGQTCSSNNQCQCVPSCGGKTCGSDGCGGICGTCSTGQTCSAAGQCTGGSGNCSAPTWTAKSYNVGDLVTADCQASIAGTTCYNNMGRLYAWRCGSAYWCSQLRPGSSQSGWWSAWTNIQQCN